MLVITRESPHFIGYKVANKQAFGKFAGFRPVTFASHFKVKEFDIFYSTLGKFVSTFDKNMSAHLNSKPVDGLRISETSCQILRTCYMLLPRYWILGNIICLM